MNIEELDKIALWLYQNDVNDWDQFTDEELIELAKLTQITEQNPYGRCYDDEIWNEMEKRGLTL